MHSHSSRPDAVADVVGHLLDPSYYSTHTSYQPRVYVDRKGNMHDPDYRHFPVLPSYASSSSPITPDDDYYADPFQYHAPRRSSSLTRYHSSSPSSSPSSYESPFDDEKAQRSSVKNAFRRCRDRRRASLSSYVEHEPVIEQVDEDDEEESDDEHEHEHEHDDGVPSCGDSLKKQWQSMSLSLNFRIFRARRRLRRVLST